jgi:RNA polymerase sigma factor (TIGR02999 family)
MFGDFNNSKLQGDVVTWSTQLHDELHHLATVYLARQPHNQTFESSDLVHEAWLRLAGTDHCWQSRAHFFASVANAMRCVLIDEARRSATVRHGGGWSRVELIDNKLATLTPTNDSQTINDALEQLALHHEVGSELVKLHYFDGLTLKEAASALGITHATAKRYFSYSKTWLCQEIQKQGHMPPRHQP